MPGCIAPIPEKNILSRLGVFKNGMQRGYLDLSGRKCEEAEKSNDGEGAS